MNASTIRFTVISSVAAALTVVAIALAASPASAREARVGARVAVSGGTVVGTAHVHGRVGVHPRARVWITPPLIFAPWPHTYNYPYPYTYPYGYPYGYPYAYPYGYPYPPGGAPAPAQPPEYMERAPQPDEPAAAAQAAPQPGYWYWCTDPQGYYPTVRECPQGWLQVAPQPPEQPRTPR